MPTGKVSVIYVTYYNARSFLCASTCISQSSSIITVQQRIRVGNCGKIASPPCRTLSLNTQNTQEAMSLSVSHARLWLSQHRRDLNLNARAIVL